MAIDPLSYDKTSNHIQFNGDWINIKQAFKTPQEVVDWLCAVCFDAVDEAEYLTYYIDFPTHYPTSHVLGFAEHFRTQGHWSVLIEQDVAQVCTTLHLAARVDLLP